MKKTFILPVVAALVTILIFSGCRRPERYSLKEKAVNNKTVKKVNPTGTSKTEKVEIIKSSPSTSSLTLKLYFANASGDKLVKEEDKVVATNEVAKASVEQLIKGPTEVGHYSAIPGGSKLLGVSVKDKVATVNFSQDFISNHPGGSSAEILTIFSIVNTLTEYPSINSVRFQVEGKDISSIAGHYDLSEPVKRDESLIVKQ